MEQKLGICMLNDAFPPAIDGVGNVVVNYAKVFHEAGNNVVVGTPEYPGSRDDYAFEVLRYPSINTIEKIGYTTGYPFDLAYIAKLKERSIDIIHVHCPMTSMFLARVLRDSIRKPIIFTYHTKYDIDIRRTIKDKHLQEKAISAIVRNISACDEVWAVSRGAADNLHDLGYRGEIRIMANGVDMPKGKASREEISSVREEFGLREGVPSYLFVGRMMWYKGIRIILDALKKLQDQGKEFRMVFVGSGLELDAIREYCTCLGLDDTVVFAGPVRDRHKLKCIFSAFDAFLFPSTFDTNGLVVREAASSGLASVLVEGSCAAEDTVNGQNAFWIEENSDSLCSLLASADTEAFHAAGERAMEELYLSWEEACEKAHQRYKEVLSAYRYEERRGFSENALDLISELSDLYGDVHEFTQKRLWHMRQRRQEVLEEFAELYEQLDENLDVWKQNLKHRRTGGDKGSDAASAREEDT